MSLVSIIIPIYKSTPSNNEEASFEQGINVFRNRQIILVCPESLDIKNYKQLFKKNDVNYWKVERFDEKYFSDKKGYNRLMLSYNFYKRFKQYKFIQIYQLDAWVFKDELDYWCKQNFDYIGAPWFENYQQGNLNLMGVGNGGFSLRKVKSALKVLSSHRRIVPLKEIWKKQQQIDYNIKGRLGSFIYIFKAFTFQKNNTHYLFNDFAFNEDLFWSRSASSIFSWYKVPSIKVAMRYAFEQNPSYLYQRNNHKLPFGCHAWEKYEPEFWEKHIVLKKKYQPK